MNHEGATTYWKSLDELLGDSHALAQRRQEHQRDSSGSRELDALAEPSGRRDFLAAMGFSLGAAGLLASCSRAPVQKAIPFLNQPEEVTPGVPNFYATTCAGCSAGCTLLVKTRDGRPIKVEGNPDSRIFGGGTCAVGQATVLSLYDEERLRGPLWGGHPTSWDDVDRRVHAGLTSAVAGQGGIVVLSGTLVSPCTRDLIARFVEHHPGARHVVYDAVSFSAIREAAAHSFGRALVPHYRFDRARRIVAFEADFLGSWLSPVEFARQYAQGRRPESGSMSRHVQFESGLSLSGSNADLRVPVAPSEQRAVVLALLQRVARLAVDAPPIQLPASSVDAALLQNLAEDLWRHRGASLVVSGIQDVPLQVAVNALNLLLDNVGRSVDVERPSLQKQGDDRALLDLVEEMHRGEVHVLLAYGVNPVYDHPDATGFEEALAKVPLVVSLADRLDETASRAHAVCPDHHFLEAWGDAEPIAGYYSLAQPTLAPLFDTRSAQQTLLKWMGRSEDHYTCLREFWRQRVQPRVGDPREFDAFWDHTLHDGVCEASEPGATPPVPRSDAWQQAAAVLQAQPGHAGRAAGEYELHLYESVALRDGRHANNPWLQELPDPVSKVTWGNFAALAPSLAAQLGVTDGDVLALTQGRTRIELPAFVQPGQSPRTISVALGYGRSAAGKVGRGVGLNAFGFVRWDDGLRRYHLDNVALQRTGRREPLAATQTHHSMEGRAIVQETTLSAMQNGGVAGREPDQGQRTLWAEHAVGEHTWGLAIDLSSCTGCSACVTACQAENNVPVVGKDEVRRGREMHWIRVDRYYSGAPDRPQTVFQPMMCQHCNNAPCESVCPVLATTHSSDGLNQQVYNRCIGTRYCENNCPYKVRRFNWFTYAHSQRFDYNMNSDLGAMVLNPDVVVRSRGVMEKCSLCIQRIQAGKLAAQRAGRPLADGDIQTACQQACPAQAIVFGDYHDPRSGLSRSSRDARHYHVLAELGTRPNVGYLTKVRNPPEAS